MKKELLFINENARAFGKKVTEGGASRSLAWQCYLEARGAKILNVPRNRILGSIYVYINLLARKNCKIFFLYPTVGVPVNSKNPMAQKLGLLFLKLCRIAVKSNEIIFDICDLKYEQLKDLGFEFESMDYLQIIERELFSLKAKFIFASESMMNYAVLKYHIPIENAEYCINGSNPIDEGLTTDHLIKIDTNKINCVYAGTLNKGRCIELMIERFPKDKRYQLILMGTGGDWIGQSTDPSITYLGAVEENIAHAVIQKCDIGLIPYDENKEYYNIAYPTKLSFYLSAGIAYLSTPVCEVERIDEMNQFGWREEIEKWDALIRGLRNEDIIKKKEAVNEVKSRFYWEAVLDNNKFLYR